jgi:hypothetical protein
MKMSPRLKFMIEQHVAQYVREMPVSKFSAGSSNEVKLVENNNVSEDERRQQQIAYLKKVGYGQPQQERDSERQRKIDALTGRNKNRRS